MAMTDAERIELGERIRRQREVAFGTKRAAYQEAGVNAATWDRAEAGESIRGDRLRSIVRTLWPDTLGDWTAIDTRSPPTDSERVAELEARISAMEELIADFIREQERDSTHTDEKHGSSGESA